MIVINNTRFLCLLSSIVFGTDLVGIGVSIDVTKNQSGEGGYNKLTKSKLIYVLT